MSEGQSLGRVDFQPRPAPHPLRWIAAKAGSDGISDDVLDRCLQVLFRADQPGSEALLEQVTPSGMTLVEPLRVHRVQTMHDEREVFTTTLDYQVEVGSEQGPGEDVNTEPLGCLP